MLGVGKPATAHSRSNSWAITVQDAGEPANANDPLEGDYLVKTETYTSEDPLRRTKPWGTLTTEDDPNIPSVIVLSEGQLRYLQDASGNLTKGSEDPTTRTTYDAEGNPNGTEEIPSDDKTITDNTLFGSASKDKIDGKSGADLIDGRGGNDQIDGGSGDDMIGGGAGSDNIKGGDGNDYFSSSAGIQNTRQQVSENDPWASWGLPDGKTGAMVMGAVYACSTRPEALNCLKKWLNLSVLARSRSQTRTARHRRGLHTGSARCFTPDIAENI